MIVELQEKPVTNLATLPPTDRAYLVLSEKHNEQALLELAGKYVDVTEIKDVADYTLANRGRITLMKARTAIQATGKSARDDATKFRQAVIDEEKRLIAIPEPEEKRLKALCKAYDDEQARIAEEARLVEQRRIADITERIKAIRSQTDGLLGSDSTAIQMRLDAVRTITITDGLFAEFTEQAEQVYGHAMTQLEQALEERIAFEVQQAEQARIAQEQAERQAELDRQAEEQRRQDAERQAEIDRRLDKIAEAEAQIEAERKADEDKRLAAERAEADRVKAENDRLEREAREREETERRKIAEAEEAERQEALRPEKEKLMEWAEYLDGMKGPVVSDDKLKALRNAAEMKVSKAGSDLMRELSGPCAKDCPPWED